MTSVKCYMCGEGISQSFLRSWAMDDLDPEFSVKEKMFQRAEWWLAGEDEGTHDCLVVTAI